MFMSAVADALDIALFLVLLRFAAVVVVSVVVAVAGCRMFSRGWNCLAVEDTCFNRLLVIIIVPAIDVDGGGVHIEVGVGVDAVTAAASAWP